MTVFFEKVQVVEQRKHESRRSPKGDVDEVVLERDGGRPDINGVGD